MRDVVLVLLAAVKAGGRLLTSSPAWLAAIVLGGCSSGPDWTRRLYSFSRADDPAVTNSTDRIVALNRVAISPLFQSRSFTYRTADDSYKQDPYAGFLVPPERALGEAIRASMRAGGVFGCVVDPGSGLVPTQVAEVFITELYGDFRNPAQPAGTMELHFLCYDMKDGAPGRVILDQVYAREIPLKERTPAALMNAWDADLREIMERINSSYAKANPNGTQ
jgi:hypothetical protein